MGTLFFVVAVFCLFAGITSAPTEREVHVFGGIAGRQKSVFKDPAYSELIVLFNTYKEFHIKHFDEHKSHLFQSNEHKYIIVKPPIVFGWGNKIPGLISGFLLAMITNRIFLLDYPHIHDYFLFPMEVEILELGISIPSNVSLAQLNGATIDFLLIHDARKELADKVLWTFIDGDYTAALLQTNKHYKDFFQKYFPYGEIFYPLSQLLLKPSPSIASKVTQFMEGNFKPYMIGLQMRLKRVTFSPHVFFTLAKAIAQRSGFSKKDISFFIASDTPALYNMSATELGKDEICFTQNEVASKQISGSMPGTQESGLVDMLLQSHCDQLIVTMTSTYGATAAAFGGLKPYRVYHTSIQGSNKSIFSANLNSEPCFYSLGHLLQKPTYATLLRSNPLWVQHYQCHE